MDYHRSSLIKAMSALSQKSIDSTQLPQLESSMGESAETSVTPIIEEEELCDRRQSINYQSRYQHSVNRKEETLRFGRIGGNSIWKDFENGSKNAGKSEDEKCTNNSTTETLDLTSDCLNKEAPQQSNCSVASDPACNKDEAEEGSCSDSSEHSMYEEEEEEEECKSMKLITEVEIAASQSQSDSITSTGGFDSHPSKDDDVDGNQKLIDFSVFIQATKEPEQSKSDPSHRSKSQKSRDTYSGTSHRSDSFNSRKDHEDRGLRNRDSSSAYAIQSVVESGETTVHKANFSRFYIMGGDSASTISTKHTFSTRVSPSISFKETIDSAASSLSALTSSIHAAASTISTKRPLPKSPSSSNVDQLKKLLAEEENRQNETEKDLEELLELLTTLQKDQFVEEEDRQKETECALWELVQLANSLQVEREALICGTVEAPQLPLEVVKEEEGSDDDISAGKKQDDFFSGLSQCAAIHNSNLPLFTYKKDADYAGLRAIEGSKIGHPEVEGIQSLPSSSSDETDEGAKRHKKGCNEGKETKQNLGQESATRLKLRTPMHQQREWKGSSLACGNLNNIKDELLEKKRDQIQEDIDCGKAKDEFKAEIANKKGNRDRRLIAASSKISSTTGENSQARYTEDMGSGQESEDDNGGSSASNGKRSLVRPSEQAVFLDVSKELVDFDRCGLLGFGYASDFILQLGLPPDLKQLPPNMSFVDGQSNDAMTPPTEITIPTYGLSEKASDKNKDNPPDEAIANDDKSTGDKSDSVRDTDNKSSAAYEPDRESVSVKYNSEMESITAILGKHKDQSSTVGQNLQDEQAKNASVHTANGKVSNPSQSFASEKHHLNDTDFTWKNLDDVENLAEYRVSDQQTEMEKTQSFHCKDEIVECGPEDEYIDPKNSSSWEKMLMDQQAILDDLPAWIDELTEEKKCLIDDASSANTFSANESTKKGTNADGIQDVGLSLSDSFISGMAETGSTTTDQESQGVKQQEEDQAYVTAESKIGRVGNAETQTSLVRDNRTLGNSRSALHANRHKEEKAKSFDNVLPATNCVSENPSLKVTSVCEPDRRGSSCSATSSKEHEQQEQDMVSSLEHHQKKDIKFSLPEMAETPSKLGDDEALLQGNEFEKWVRSEEPRNNVSRAMAKKDLCSEQKQNWSNAEQHKELSIDELEKWMQNQVPLSKVFNENKEKSHEAVVVETVTSNSTSVATEQDDTSEYGLQSNSWLFQEQRREDGLSEKEGQEPEGAALWERNASQEEIMGSNSKNLPDDHFPVNHRPRSLGHYHRVSLRRHTCPRQATKQAPMSHRRRSGVWISKDDCSVQETLEHLTACLTNLFQELFACHETACSDEEKTHRRRRAKHSATNIARKEIFPQRKVKTSQLAV